MKTTKDAIVIAAITCAALGCGDKGDASASASASAAPSASSSTKSTASGATAPASAATSAPAGSASVATSATAPAADAFSTFSGAPAFEGKPKAKTFMGTQLELPSGFQDFDDGTAKLVGFNNPSGTMKARLWISSAEGRPAWATPEKMAESEKIRTGEVTQGGKVIGSMAVHTACEEAVHTTLGVHPTKIEWQGAPKSATFGAANAPGAVFEAKDKEGKWAIYCVRIGFAEKLGVAGAIGWRTDKDGEANAKQVANIMKSLRPAGS